jgi:lipopolysaccharide export LptBFGC system permease protein LptF
VANEMGIRSLIRDVLAIYLSFFIFQNIINGKIKAELSIILASLFLFLLTIWFLLEKIGIIPKFGE